MRAFPRRALRTVVVLPVLTVATVATGCGGDGGRSADATAPASSATGTEPTSTQPTGTQPTSTQPTAQGTPASSPASSPVSSPGSAGASGSPGRLIRTAGSEYGPMLFDASGQAIYLFDKETSARPECYGACAEAWPPVLAGGRPRAGGAVRAGLLGTTVRTDGSRQVTYAGHPLYYYAHEGRNQVLCHNVREYGGLWLVVTPSGRPAA